MIQKYTYGTPFETDAIVTSIPASEGTPTYGTISTENGFSFTYDMNDNDVVYGLGESNRGINKRGYVYESNCSDQPNHTEDKISLYGAHNFLVISGKQTFGLFVDYPGKLKFDIGYTLSSQLNITCEDADLYLYVIEGETPYDIVKQFRKIIGRSYIPPKFAFGFGQSRWGYTTADDFRKAADGYRENNIPIDMVYMDIDYMEDYKDFTVNQENFPDLDAYIKEMKEKDPNFHGYGIRIDSGDLAYLSKKAKAMLEEAGFPDAVISASSDLDENLIASLKLQGAKISLWGVGTKLISSDDCPAFGGVYKLAAEEDENGKFIPKIKLSNNPEKVTNPGIKKVFRIYEKSTGKIKADLIALDDETIDENKPLAIYDSNAKWKNMRLEPGTYRVRELLVPVFIDGKQVYESPATMDIQAYCDQEKASLWDEHLRLNNPHIVPVDLSDKLMQLKTKLIDNMSKRYSKSKKRKPKIPCVRNLRFF